MAGPRFAKLEREELKTRAAQLSLLGRNQYEIAQELGVSQGTVCVYLQQISDEYKLRQFGSREEQLAKQMESLAWIKREVTDAWEASKEDRAKRTVETHPDGSAKVKVEEEGRLPASEYQRLYLEALAVERKLLGLEPEPAAANVNVNVNVNNVWDALAGVLREDSADDPVELELKRALESPSERNGSEVGS